MNRQLGWTFTLVGVLLLILFASVNTTRHTNGGGEVEEWRVGLPAAPWLIYERTEPGAPPVDGSPGTGVTFNLFSWSGLVGLLGVIGVGAGQRTLRRQPPRGAEVTRDRAA